MNMSTEIGDGVIMDYFVSMLLIGIGVALLATGLFTSYFGAGKSQKIGYGLLIVGIAAIVVTYVLTFETGAGVASQFNDEAFTDALISGISALAGMIIGLFVILFVLMKVDTIDDLEDLDLEDLEDLDLDEELKKLEEELNAEATDSAGEEE